MTCEYRDGLKPGSKKDNKKMSLKNLLKDSDVFGHLAHKGKGLKETSKKTFAETNQRTNCYPEKKADIPATSRTQRFHANDVSLPRYGQFF